jgi:hypothetical protein
LYNGQVVIAFTGTLIDGFTGSLPDNRANALLGLGIADTQIKEAAEFYTRVKEALGDNIVFTGHSLGGGLAALMGAFFNKDAYTFDPAPFRLAATRDVADEVEEYLVSRGLPVDPELQSYTTVESFTIAQQVGAVAALSAFIGAITRNPFAALMTAAYLGSQKYPTAVRGQERITAVAAEGEFLTAGYGVAQSLLRDLRLMNTPDVAVIQHGAATSLNPMSELHSINMLAALLAEPRLAQLSREMSGLLPSMFDAKLYSFRSNSSDTDVWVKVLREQYAETGASNILGRLADDLELLRGEMASHRPKRVTH